MKHIALAPKLYKKTSTGAIQYWEVFVCETNGHSSHYDIYTSYGQVGTDSPQSTIDTIKEGKNVGKKNETSIYEQAKAEAKAMWEKKKKSGYVESIKDAENDKVDAIIEGGILPMLAQSYIDVVYDTRPGHESQPPQFIRTKDAKKIKFPCFIQPKLDGIRCIAILKDGKCTLWSRTRKPIASCPHIVAEIESMNIEGDLILDGELYNQEFKNNFEHIVHLVRQETPDPEHTDVQYHIYDTIDDSDFDVRNSWLNNTSFFRLGDTEHLKLVETLSVRNEDEAMVLFKAFRKSGYEGAMLRNSSAKYVNKRSKDLQKMKEFHEKEFEILGIVEGRGKLQGHAIFVCRADNGKEFEVKQDGDTAALKRYFDNHKLWENKELTVQYQGLTVANQVPRFPVGKAIRDYE